MKSIKTFSILSSIFRSTVWVSVELLISGLTLRWGVGFQVLDGETLNSVLKLHSYYNWIEKTVLYIFLLTVNLNTFASVYSSPISSKHQFIPLSKRFNLWTDYYGIGIRSFKGTVSQTDSCNFKRKKFKSWLSHEEIRDELRIWLGKSRCREKASVINKKSLWRSFWKQKNTFLIYGVRGQFISLLDFYNKGEV